MTGSGKHRVGNVVAAALAERGFAVALHYNRSADEAREVLAGFHLPDAIFKAKPAKKRNQDGAGTLNAAFQSVRGDLHPLGALEVRDSGGKFIRVNGQV